MPALSDDLPQKKIHYFNFFLLCGTNLTQSGTLSISVTVNHSKFRKGHASKLNYHLPGPNPIPGQGRLKLPAPL